ncbi:MAG: hypothetical protein ABIW84_05250 [Ilumatobacteraceae bacterium]
MDLREWIASDHAFVIGRFHSAIAQHVPVAQWKGRRTGVNSAEHGDDRHGDDRRDDRRDGHGDGHGKDGPSIAWLLFHTTYHQDLALNTAIRDHAPILADHRSALGLAELGPEAGLTESEDPVVTDALSLAHLGEYVDAVNARTATWIDHLSTMALDSVPSSSYRLEHLAGIPADGPMDWLHSMWNGKPVSWLVQWECIGHGHAHVGEMVGIRNRLGLSPF